MKTARTALAFLLILSALFITGCKDKQTQNQTGDFGYKLNDAGEATIINCKTTIALLEIPSEIDGHKVTSIGDGAFFNYSAAEEIIIPEGVRAIGKSAFEHCTNLKKVTVADSVESISEKAFNDCTKLETVNVISNSALNYIGINAFSACRSLKTEEYEGALYLPLGTEKNAILLSASSTSIEKASIHADTKIIAANAFYQCEKISEVTLPEKLVSICDKAFYGCTNLETIYFNARNMRDLSLGSAVFERVATKSETMTLVIGKSVERIPAYLMDSASRLRVLNFEEDCLCNTIGKYAFAKTPLPDVTIPESIKVIEEGAFANCERLNNLKLSAKSANDLTADNNVFDGAGASTSGVVFTVGSSVERIPSYFCTSLKNLKQVKFENNETVKSFGKNAFFGCNGILRVDITSKKGWCEAEYENEYANPLRYGNATLVFNDNAVGEGLILNADVNYISSYAFAGYKPLNKIVLPLTVKSIGESAFFATDNLYIVYFCGTKSEWSNLTIKSGNDKLLGSSVFFYSENAPTEAGNYWKFADDGTPAVWRNDNIE